MVSQEEVIGPGRSICIIDVLFLLQRIIVSPLGKHVCKSRSCTYLQNKSQTHGLFSGLASRRAPFLIRSMEDSTTKCSCQTHSVDLGMRSFILSF